MPDLDFRSRQVDAAVADFLESIERGEPLSREAFLAEHAEIAAELREFLIDHQALEQVARRSNLDARTKSEVRSPGRQPGANGDPAPLPRQVGDFELLEELGRGGMGVVYQARQAKLGRTVAVKMILAGQMASESDVKRFYAEAHAAAALDHPLIVPIFEVGQQAGQHYFAMGYVEGESLAQRLVRGPLPARQAAGIVQQVALAVQYAHEKGIIHRDLKPANILLDADGRVRVTDFGLAKCASDGTGITLTGQVLGTPNYIPPEQLAGQKSDLGPGADVYALGATLYALVTGRPPFQAASTLATMKQVLEQDPVPPREFDASIPRDLETIALKCLEKAPAKRYRSAQELADDLTRFLADKPILARRSTSAERVVRWCRRNPVVAALTSAVAALLVAAVVILTLSNAGIRRESAAKDAALHTARRAVDQMLTRVASEKLNHTPLAHPLRAALLEDALQFYEGFLTGTEDDRAVQELMQEALQHLGCIQRELGRYDAACRSFERSIQLLESLSASDPNPPTFREKLAAAHEALAFTWQIHPQGSDGQMAETYFHRTLNLYRELQEAWPLRRQPVANCLQQLGVLASRQNDPTKAEQFWRESIVGGEAYLQQQPQNLDARCNVCWACAGLCDAIFLRSEDRFAEAGPIIDKGLQHASIMLQQNSRSSQAREVAAFLQCCLARSHCRTDRADDAVELFEKCLREMRSLCAEFPSHRAYWDLVNFFQKEAVGGLRGIQRPDLAQQSLRQTVEWLQKTAPQVPNDSEPQANLRRCQVGLTALLRETGQEQTARALDQAFDAN